MVAEAYYCAVRDQHITVVAPGKSVAELQRRLDPRWAGIDIHVIPHGFPPLKPGPAVEPRARADKRLRLLVLGRIQPGKGQQLLIEALPQLRPHAQVYLLGTGKSGEAFFGLPGVNVIVDFEREPNEIFSSPSLVVLYKSRLWYLDAHRLFADQL